MAKRITKINGYYLKDQQLTDQLTNYQTKSDSSLNTTNKTVNGSINELKAAYDILKNNIYISDYEKPQDGDYSTILQDAINNSVNQHKKIIFNNGVYKISKKIQCPDDCIIEIEGNSDCFSNSMNRKSKDFNGNTLWYENPNNETLIIYSGSESLFTVPGGTGKGTIFKFKNLSFRNALDENSNYLLQGRVISQIEINSSSKGKVYSENCLFSGFKVCFGEIFVSDILEEQLNLLDGRQKETKPNRKLEKCCFVGSRCRFVACGCSVNLGVDSRFVDCSFNNGWYGISFLENSGISTISNCRLEWLKINGVYSEDSHDITIISSEFDRIGHAGIFFKNNTKLNISNNIFRRCGSDTNYDYTARTKIVHLYIESCTGGVINSNVTIAKAISDNGGIERPANSVCIRTNNSIIVMGNDFTGCTTGSYNLISDNANSIILLNSGENISESITYQLKNDSPAKTIVENNILYLLKSDGTKIDNGTTLPIYSGGGSVDLSSYQTKSDSSLNTTSKTISGAINELKTNNDTIKDKFTTQSTETKIGLFYNGSEIFSLPIQIEDDTF